MNRVTAAASSPSWLSLELVVVVGLLTMSLFVGSTLAVVAYKHGFTALPDAAAPRASGQRPG